MVTQCSHAAAARKVEIFILSGLSLSRTVDTKTDFNLNNIIATLSLISISSVKIRLAGKCPQTSSQLRSMNAGEHRRSEICGLDVTISARYDWSVASQSISFHYVIGVSGILPYKQECYLMTEMLGPVQTPNFS